MSATSSDARVADRPFGLLAGRRVELEHWLVCLEVWADELVARPEPEAEGGSVAEVDSLIEVVVASQLELEGMEDIRDLREGKEDQEREPGP